MADLVHDDGFPLQAKANAIIASPHALPPRQLPRERLDSAHVRPLPQADEKAVQSRPDRVRQPLLLFGRLACQLDGCHEANIGLSTGYVKILDAPGSLDEGQDRRVEVHGQIGPGGHD